MPRARTTTTEEETVVAPKKRAPRKRVAPLVDGETPAPRAPRAPRKRAVPTSEEVSVVAEREDTPRRAPTPLRAERKAASRGRRSLVWTLGIVLLLCGAGAGIGLSDRGQIDVVAVVNERNERINRGEVREGESTITVPVQSTDTRPNGGLTPADAPTAPIPAPEATASSTATTTEATEERSGTGDTTEPAASDSESVPASLPPAAETTPTAS